MKSSKTLFMRGLTLSFPLSKCQNFKCYSVLPGGEFADSKSEHN